MPDPVELPCLASVGYEFLCGAQSEMKRREAQGTTHKIPQKKDMKHDSFICDSKISVGRGYQNNGLCLRNEHQN